MSGLVLAGLVLVIGGGPSVTDDLVRLWNSGFFPDVVLSANEHGTYQHLYDVDYLVTVSAQHTRHRMPMERYLRNFRYPIIGPFPWADFPLHDWHIAADSGQAAVAVAALHGARRIVPVGLDGFRVGPRYFHGREEITERHHDPMTLPVTLLRQDLAGVLSACERCEVRPVSGYLTRLFDAYAFP